MTTLLINVWSAGAKRDRHPRLEPLVSSSSILITSNPLIPQIPHLMIQRAVGPIRRHCTSHGKGVAVEGVGDMLAGRILDS